MDRGDDLEAWLADAVLLTTGHQTEHGIVLDEYWPPRPAKTKYPFHLGPHPPEESQRSVLRFDADTKEGTALFTLSESGERVYVMCVKGLMKPGLDHGGALYLPFHRLCLCVADRFIDSVPSSLIMAHTVTSDGITSVKSLWEVLFHRLQGDSMGFPDQYLPEPHDYFGGWPCRNAYWEPDALPQHGEVSKSKICVKTWIAKLRQLQEQNPVDIPNLTSSILQNLKPAESAHASSPSQQNWYFEAFLNKQIFPWLWDLDTKAILEKQRAGHWDWELLVRKLSIKTIHEPDDESIDIPLQLRNRRRIWRLLEEARMNDVAGEWERRMAMNEAMR